MENGDSQAGRDAGDGRHDDGSVNGHVPHVAFPVPRTVSAKGSGGVSATVIVTVRRGSVWMSIVPPFTWEAILEPGEVDELVRTLTQAGKEARRRA